MAWITRWEAEEFQSTPPVREATQIILSFNPISVFQSTPPVREATTYKFSEDFTISLSIHASREGGDMQNYLFYLLIFLSIHASREGGDAATLCGT